MASPGSTSFSQDCTRNTTCCTQSLPAPPGLCPLAQQCRTPSTPVEYPCQSSRARSIGSWLQTESRGIGAHSHGHHSRHRGVSADKGYFSSPAGGSAGSADVPFQFGALFHHYQQHIVISLHCIPAAEAVEVCEVEIETSRVE